MSKSLSSVFEESFIRAAECNFTHSHLLIFNRPQNKFVSLAKCSTKIISIVES